MMVASLEFRYSTSLQGARLSVSDGGIKWMILGGITTKKKS